METRSRAYDYGQIHIDDARILSEMAITDEHVYVLTPNKVNSSVCHIDVVVV